MGLQPGTIVEVKTGFEGILSLFKRYRLTNLDKYGNAQVTDANNGKAPYIETHITQLKKA
jgi:hypothetical protein